MAGFAVHVPRGHEETYEYGSGAGFTFFVDTKKEADALQKQYDSEPTRGPDPERDHPHPCGDDYG